MICVMENYDNDMMIMIVVMTVQNTNPRFCSPDHLLSLLDWVLFYGSDTRYAYLSLRKVGERSLG